MNPYHVIKKPLLTEKTTRLKDAENTYVFAVDRMATKEVIKVSVEKLFNVKVRAVRTVVQRGKFKRFFRYQQGHTAAFKKAYVTLNTGNKIEIFEGV